MTPEQLAEITPEYLAAVRARAEAATPGPWRHGTNPPFEDGPDWPWGDIVTVATHPVLGGLSDIPTQIYAAEDPPDNDADLEFLVHARTDIPALLDYIEELQEALRGIEDCVAHPDRVKGEIAGTICGKCLAQVSTLADKEPPNA